MESITITLTIPELMAMPGDAIIRILEKANPSPEFLCACREYECRPDHGHARWGVLNRLRTLSAAR